MFRLVAKITATSNLDHIDFTKRGTRVPCFLFSVHNADAIFLLFGETFMRMDNRRSVLKTFGFAILASSLLPVSRAMAKDKSIIVKFKPGSSSARYSGRIQSYDVVIYKFKAYAGQKISVDLATAHYALYFSLYDLTGDDGLVNGASDPWSGVLPTDGAYEITVGMERSAARRGEVADYKLTMIVG
jgi:hypothetical protein